MNIGIDARMLGTRHGGIGRYVLELVKNILAQDTLNKYYIFINSKDVVEDDLKQLRQFNNLTIIPTGIRHYSIKEQTGFYKILRKYALDLVHFPNFNVPLLYNGKFIVTIHDMVHHKIGGAKKTHFFHYHAYKKIIQSAADRSKAIITVSEYSKKDIVKYLRQPESKVQVIYEGVNLPKTASAESVQEAKNRYILKRPYFLFVGVLERKKNIINLTRGFDLFINKYGLDMDLVIAGKVDSHYPEIKHKALDIKNSDRLVFTGHVPDSELAALYSGAYAFVSASLHEGFGLPGVEAMQFGLPLIVSNIDVFNEVYDNAAIYFNPLDVNDIADKLHLLAKDENYYKQVQQHSMSRGRIFDWKKTAEQTLGVYKQILSNKL